ncbi:MAG: hypothetical protein H7829_13990 [Magnetococcus sp. THC-1_WYH]
MMHFFSPLPQRMDPDVSLSEDGQTERDGCWKKPLNPKAKDWLGNLHPLSDDGERRFYHEDGAPAAEISGKEDLW